MLEGKEEMQILQITENNTVVAKGIHIPEAVMSFDDDDKSIISYQDTGIFILSKGSCAASTEDKYKPYIGADRKTNIKIVFQSLNAAAKFVLGDKGRTNAWK